MDRKNIDVKLRLPNGKEKQFTVHRKKNWKTDLKQQIKHHYPRTDAIELVEELSEKKLSSGNPLQSNVMFKIEDHYYALGHVTAKLQEG